MERESVNVAPMRVLTLLLAIALACLAVAVCGNVGFIGLVAPHLARSLIGNRHLSLLAASMLIGALLLVAADA